MSVASSSGSRRKQDSVLWHGVMTAAIIVGMVTVVMFLPFKWALDFVMQKASATASSELRIAGIYCFAVFAICAFATPFEGGYIGHLKTTYCNRVRSLSQGAGIVALIACAFFFNDVLAFTAAVTLGPLAAAIVFIVKGSVDFRIPKGFRYSKHEGLPLITEGVGFLASSLAVLFYGGGSLPVYAIFFSEKELITASVMSKVVQVYFSLVGVLLIPLGAALKNSIAEHDFVWSKMAIRKSLIVVMGMGAGSALGLLCFGNYLLSRWAGSELPELNKWLLPTAALMIVISWTYIWVYVSFSVKGSRMVAQLAVVEVAVNVLLYYMFGHRVPSSCSLYFAAGVMAVFSGTILPIFAIKSLRDSEECLVLSRQE